MAFGDVAVETDQPSLPMLSGAGSRTWVEHSFAPHGSAVVEVTGRAGDVDAATDLRAGVALAGGFRLELVPTSAGASAPVPAVEAVEPVEAVDAIEAPAPPMPDEREPVDATTAIPLVAEITVEPLGPEPAAAAPPARPTASAPRTPPVDIDDPAAALAAIQAAAVGADGEPLQAAPVVPPRRAPVPRSDEIVEPHDADVTLPPPASEALLLEAGAEAPDARGSLVDAKRCGNGHPNPPTAATCEVCGEFLAPGAASITHLARPSLGRLALDDGGVVELDQELLIGRNPDRDTDPARQGMRRVKLVGDKVSRSHLEIRFQGWEVLVADCGSTNGTFVVPRPGGQVATLEPGRSHMVEPGATVYFGSRSFTIVGRHEARP